MKEQNHLGKFMKILVVLNLLLLTSPALAFDNCHEHNLKGVKGKCIEDITYTEIIQYLNKIEILWEKYEKTNCEKCDNFKESESMKRLEIIEANMDRRFLVKR